VDGANWSVKADEVSTLVVPVNGRRLKDRAGRDRQVNVQVPVSPVGVGTGPPKVYVPTLR